MTLAPILVGSRKNPVDYTVIPTTQYRTKTGYPVTDTRRHTEKDTASDTADQEPLVSITWPPTSGRGETVRRTLLWEILRFHSVFYRENWVIKKHFRRPISLLFIKRSLKRGLDCFGLTLYIKETFSFPPTPPVSSPTRTFYCMGFLIILVQPC